MLLLQQPVRVVGAGRRHRQRRVTPRQIFLLQVRVGLLQRASPRPPACLSPGGPGPCRILVPPALWPGDECAGIQVFPTPERPRNLRRRHRWTVLPSPLLIAVWSSWRFETCSPCRCNRPVADRAASSTLQQAMFSAVESLRTKRANRRLVASSIIAISSIFSPRPSNQSCSLVSHCTISPYRLRRARQR